MWKIISESEIISESFDCVGGVNDVPSRDFDYDRMLDLTVCAEVFSKLAIDIVGPLKTCQSGNRFILTVIDFMTH